MHLFVKMFIFKIRVINYIFTFKYVRIVLYSFVYHIYIINTYNMSK